MPIAFQRIVIILLENASRNTVMTNKYMNQLRRKGVFLSNARGVTHPSQPNYFSLTGGDTLGFSDDCSGWVTWQGHESTNPSDSITSVVDLLEAQQLTWKAYAEDLEASDIVSYPGNPPDDHGWFARRHVPFLSYPNIVNSTERAGNIVNAQEHFETDVAAGTLPTYSFYSPNLINDGHSLPDNTPANPTTDTGQLENIQKFLERFLGSDPIGKFPPETLIAITFDEAYPVSAEYNIYTLLIGDMLTPGTVRYDPYNHYSLLRTIEDNFGIGTLGRNDASAIPYWFVR